MSRPILEGLPVRVRDGIGLLASREARRFTFAFDVLRVRGWRATRDLAWSDVRSARLAAAGRRVSLNLTYDDGTVVRVPLTSYHGSRRLLADIEHRLPVAVAATASLQAALERVD